MATPEPASSLALLSALCNGSSIYDERGRRYEMWESDADKPGGPSIVQDMFLEPPGREPETDPNANRIKVEWPDAVRILVRNPPKPATAKSSEPTAEAILNALRDGKRVVDADGDKVAICCWNTINEQWLDGNVRFPLTIKPEPKPRRRVTREEAIIAMVRDPEQRAWDENGYEYRYACGMISWHDKTKRGWVSASSPPAEFLYLDPPEVEK